MKLRRNRKPVVVEPTQPAATLASIEAIIGDEMALDDRFVEKLFRRAKHVECNSPYLLWDAAVLVAWELQSIVRSRVRPWKRTWSWGADDRRALANEIAPLIATSNEVHILTKSKLDVVIFVINNETKIEITMNDIVQSRVIFSVKRLNDKIITCRQVNHCIFVHPEMQILQC